MSDDAPAVAVRGDDAGGVAESVVTAGGVVADALTDADAVFAVGEDALFSFAEASSPAPILPVGCSVGHDSIAPVAVGEAVRALATGDTRTVSHPVLTVSVGGEPVGNALADVTLMTEEPARISEYAVATPTERVGSFRADGVVVATPLGSTGYARAVGGSVLAPGTGVVAVPISPYTTLSNSWVLGLPVTLSVERDEAAVSLVLDDEVRRTVPADAPVELAVGGSRSFLRIRGDEGESTL
ncbi:NAD(+)/NADH kinase [Halogeometricum limi]|uniref:NAD+ kinase n=1 Tax=Halogeometricum limi TaxID=555875 RepID=A0A1I6GZE5_9EURY|nr:NAD(+)/NADH kinase [Halogeometricum limi]SFR47562.1 NAD+ kinase [Halogeometricum limi]